MKGAFRAVAGVAGVAVSLGTADVASAQAARRPVSVGIAVGATVPISDFANDTKAGLHGAAFLQYEPDRGIWGVRGEVAYHRSDFTDEALADVGAGPNDKVTNGITHVGATALLLGNKRDRSVTPYLLGGLGLYRVTVSSSSGSVSLSASENGFGFNGGAGLRLGRTSGLFVEARFHQFSITPKDASKSTYQMIPVTVGIRF